MADRPGEILEHNTTPDEWDVVLAKMAPGQVGWFTDGPDDGPSGYFVKVNDGVMVAAQDMPKACFDELEVEDREALGDHSGYFLTIDDDRKPRGEQRTILGKVVFEEAEFVARAVAMLLISEQGQ